MPSRYNGGLIARVAREFGLCWYDAEAAVTAHWRWAAGWMASRDIWAGCEEIGSEAELEGHRAFVRLPGFGTFRCGWRRYCDAAYRRSRQTVKGTRRGRVGRPRRGLRYFVRHPVIGGAVLARAEALRKDGKGQEDRE